MFANSQVTDIWCKSITITWAPAESVKKGLTETFDDIEYEAAIETKSDPSIHQVYHGQTWKLFFRIVN